MRRLLVPAILALVTVGSASAAVRAGAESAPVVAEGPATVTPVFSARRVPAFLAAPVADRRLQAALGEVVARSPADTCLSVSAAGRPLFSHNHDRPLAPASLEKLLTATAVLAEIGPEARFRTVAGASAPPESGVVEGDLWFQGAGDPLLATDAYVARFESQPQVHTDAEALADQLVAAGLRRVEGRVVGDDSRYDRSRYVASWPDRFVTQNQTGPLSALTVNDGFVAFPLHPDAPGDPVPAPDPPALAAAVLTGLLEGRGVDVVGEPASGAAPGDLVEVAAVESPPMGEVVGQMVRESDNTSAELLLKELGWRRLGEGSTDAGADALAAVLDELALPDEAATVVDGSGLDPGNRLSCALVMAVLDRSGPGSDLAAGLAVAGQTGTLRERFVGTPVEGRLRAKTGSLNNVTSLAGFVDSTQGQLLSFSFIVNAGRVDDQDIALQDELGAILVRYPEGPPLSELGPEPLPPGERTQGDT